ncbi:MAG: PQQ-dependent dehydrogenase, methanol/ethanol family [Acidobacteriia bacterium]|nr:PQQ-dependent dehydrogenase, methanol/ethanol family [Terriglobia bacterium]
MKRRLLLVLLLAGWWGGPVRAQITYDRILHADKEPQNWLTYSGGLSSQRHSGLKQITPANVKNLDLQWVWQARSTEKFETTALVVNGVLYTVQAPDDVYALDAATGRLFWTYPYTPAPEARACCGRVNRGLAILGDTLYLGTLDAHLLALDAKTGKLLWNVEVAKASENYSITHAPLVVKDKVILGTAGGDMGIRGLIAAYDAKTGKEAWRFNTIPAPGEAGHDTWQGDSWMRGGASIWNTGSYDPETNLTFWGTGNPAPDWDGSKRTGDNLYSDCVVALDADTGKLKWYYQFTPHDEVDYDSTQVPVLADIEWQGRPRKTMLWANRNGLFYVLDRTNGQFLLGKPFVKVNWMDGFDEKGRPRRVPGKVPGGPQTIVTPTVLGGTNWYPPSYSPSTGLFYVSAWENTGTFLGQGGGLPRGTGPNPMGQTNLHVNTKKEEEGYGAVRALDPHTGERKWEFKMTDITWAGVLTTASDLLFSGGSEGYFFALDARTGDLLWKFTVGGQVNSGPMSYAVNGRQYVTVAAGSSLFAFALRE